VDPEEVEMKRSVAAPTGWPGEDEANAEGFLSATVAQIAGNAGTAIFIADARFPEAPVIFVNRQFSQRTGLSADDVIGRSWTLLRTSAPDLLAGLDVHPNGPIAVELPNIGSDDRSMPTCFVVSAVRDTTDSVLAYIGMARE
jgi:hypothetical protein